ncbi:hypothetical protein Micbo1qcDRAFT_172328 [Microdochium bolleyi]|uniref:BTB domain-containing protein n=1 Tax=Microdochium bolleyi TaxID=196109 RepID=A0A136JFV6_9PEZI|nr:hypothetical protein Micbo1qcDRAFT_172328 [Microdochium bolleyi]
MILRSLSTRSYLNPSEKLPQTSKLIKVRRSLSQSYTTTITHGRRLGSTRRSNRHGTATHKQHKSSSSSSSSAYDFDTKPERPRKGLKAIVDFVMGLLSARSSTSSILETAPFGEVDIIMDLPGSYVRSDLDRTWRVHSLIVCSRSTWFDQALNGESNESGKRVVTVSEENPDDIESLLQFIYSGDFSLTKWAKATNIYTAACEAFYLADKYSVELLKRPALKQIAVQTRHRLPGDPWEQHLMDAVRLEYCGPNLPQRSLRQLFLLEAVRSRGRYRAPNFRGVFSDESLEEEEKGRGGASMRRYRDQVRKLEKMLLEEEGSEQAVARMLRAKYNFVSEEASRAAWVRDFPPQGRVV